MIIPSTGPGVVSGTEFGEARPAVSEEISQTSPAKRQESRLLSQRAHALSIAFQTRIDRWKSLASQTS